jgi:Ca2+-binding RTX toxin-like protein
VAAADKLVVKGGAGNDTFIAGANDTLTGGGGSDVFVFTTAGTNTITDFAAATGRIALSNAGFQLGLSGASATPQALPTALLSPNANGKMATPANRFGYNAATGSLFYDPVGSTNPAAAILVAHLTGNPAITLNNLFFVS